jgi:ABC-type transport system substrate-binding protein
MIHRDSPTGRHPAVLFLSILVACALLVGACGSDDGGDEDDGASATSNDDAATVEPTPGGKLVYGIDAESDGYNPQSKRFAQAGHTVASAVFDPLATWDADGNAVPYLATSFDHNDDFTEWTIGIPEDVVFHSGEPMTVDSVVQILDAARTGLVTSSSLLGVEAVAPGTEPNTVVASMAAPWPDFPAILTTQAGYMFDPAMLTDPDSAARPVGTGPFEFESWERESSFTVVRNPDYWRTDEFGNQLPYLEEIEFRILPDAGARNEALVNGDIDMLYTLTPSAIVDLRGAQGLTIQEYNLGDEDLISLETDDVARDVDGPGPSPERVSPFNNIHARLALAYATDQDAFRRDIMRDVTTEAYGPWSPGQLGYRDDTGFPRLDLDKAREEIELYKQDTGAPSLAFTYSAADDIDSVEAANYLKNMWAEAGIEVTIYAVPQADIIVNAVIGNYEATDWRNWAQPDPGAEYVWFHSSSVRPLEEGISLNISHLKDDEVDAALDASRAPDATEDQRDEAFATVAERFGSQVPYIWLGRVGWMMASQPTIHGWEVSTQNGTIATVGAKTWISEIWVG